MNDIHSTNVIDRLHKNAFPFIGQASDKQITIPELLMLLRRIEERGDSDES